MEKDTVVVIFDDVKWDWVLNNTLSPQVKTIVANIMKSDIRLIYEDINTQAPKSIIAKLSFILYNRFKKFNGDTSKGINIIAPFLLEDCVTKLEAFVIELAHCNNYEPDFINWIEYNNNFTN